MEIELTIQQRRMRIQARVMRKMSDEDLVYVALRFLDLKPEDFRFLYETLYGRPFDPTVVDSESGIII
jgi:hypothetical protein